MAARKSKQTEATGAEARAFTVVLEEIRAQNKGFGEGQELLREQMGALRGQMGALGEEVGVLGEQVGVLREEMRAGFAQVDRRFERIEQDVGLVKIAVLDHARELKEIRVALGNKVDRHELEMLVARGMR